MEFGTIIAIAVVLVLTVFLLFLQVKREGLKEVAEKLILEAEEELDNGSEKMDYCIEKLIALIPMPFSLFITKNMIKELIQGVFDNIKPLLDYKKEI